MPMVFQFLFLFFFVVTSTVGIYTCSKIIEYLAWKREWRKSGRK